MNKQGGQLREALPDHLPEELLLLNKVQLLLRRGVPRHASCWHCSNAAIEDVRSQSQKDQGGKRKLPLEGKLKLCG